MTGREAADAGEVEATMAEADPRQVTTSAAANREADPLIIPSLISGNATRETKAETSIGCVNTLSFAGGACARIPHPVFCLGERRSRRQDLRRVKPEDRYTSTSHRQKADCLTAAPDRGGGPGGTVDRPPGLTGRVGQSQRRLKCVATYTRRG